MKGMTRAALLGSLLGAACISHAEVYRWVNDRGEVEYSDQYREGAEKVEIQPLSTIQMPKPTDVAPDPSPEPQPQLQSTLPTYARLQITFPEADSAFHSGDGNISVLVTSSPDLLPGHSYRISMDGQVAGVSESGSIPLVNVDRGTHELKLEVIDSTEVIQSAAPIRFTLHRPIIEKTPRTP